MPLPKANRSRGRDDGRPPLRPLSPPFRVSVAEHGGVRVVEVDGEIDMLTAPTLAGVLSRDAALGPVVLDLGKVPFISSSGLRLIASEHRRRSRSGGLALAAVQRNVARLLEIVGWGEGLLMAADSPTAIRLLDDRG